MDIRVKYSKNEVRDQPPAFTGQIKNTQSLVSSHPYVFN
jgi:hypothetical protein